MAEENKFKAGNVLTQMIDGDMVVLNLDNEEYYTFDSTATRFWEVVLEHGQGASAEDVLLEEYDVDRSRLAADLNRWVAEMQELGLLVRD